MYGKEYGWGRGAGLERNMGGEKMAGEVGWMYGKEYVWEGEAGYTERNMGGEKGLAVGKRILLGRRDWLMLQKEKEREYEEKIWGRIEREGDRKK